MTDASPRARAAFWFGFTALYLVHLAFVGHFFPIEMLTSGEAISWVGDFATHINQTKRVIEGLEGWGRGWVYDPHLLAGHPAGTIFDADNKGWELFTYLGMKLGWTLEAGHTRFVALSHLALPFVILATALAFSLGRSATLIAVGLGIGLWHFDSFVHWCWWAGMVAYDFGAYFFLLPLATFHLYLERRHPAWALSCGLLLGVAHLIHPYVFFVLAPPMLAMFGRAWSGLTPSERAWVFSIAGVTLAMNGWWLHNAIRFWHYILDSAYYGQSGISFLPADYASFLINPETTGLLGTRTGFRFTAWALGIAGLWRWRQRLDRRALPFGLAILLLIALSYLGGHIAATRQLQPYRFVMPAAYLAIFPAGAFVADTVQELRASTSARPAAWLALAIAVPAGQHLVRDASYFLPDLHPTVHKTTDGLESPIGADGHRPTATYRYGVVEPDFPLRDYVAAHDDGQSRWLVENPFYGEELAWRTDAQVLGGFTLRNLQHSYANFFRRRPQGIAPRHELRRYFETYAVGWVVVSTPDHWMWRVPNPELELVATIGTDKIFRTRVEPNLVAHGGGRVEASTNRIAVTGSDPNEPLRLRYHWMETLRCRPDCRIERVEVDGSDPVGFIEIPAPHPADLEVWNSYAF